MAPLSPIFVALASLAMAFASPVIEANKKSITVPLMSNMTCGNNNTCVTGDGIEYFALIGVGTPATEYTLRVHTTLGNTWIGASKPYNRTSTSQDTGKKVNYTSENFGGQFSGEEFEDTVTVAPGLVASKQSIGIGDSDSRGSVGEGIDGVLGLGPTGLTAGTLDGTQDTIPTIGDTLRSQNIISTNLISLSLQPYQKDSGSNGNITFGAIDESAITGNVSYVPITKTPPSSDFWGFDLSVKYNGETIMNTTAGIIDIESPFIILSPDAAEAYRKATGAVVDEDINLLKVTEQQYNAISDLEFVIGGVSYNLTRNAQLFPRSLNEGIDQSPDDYFLTIGAEGMPEDSGFGFIIGNAFLQRFYTVLDSENKQIGFAPNHFTRVEV